MGWEKNGGMWKVMVGYMVLQDVWVFWRWCGLQDRIVVGCWPLRFLKPCIHTHLCKFHSNHTLDFLYRNGIPGCFPWLLFSFNVFPTFPSSFLWLRCGTVGLHDIPTLISREFEFSWFSLWLPHTGEGAMIHSLLVMLSWWPVGRLLFSLCSHLSHFRALALPVHGVKDLSFLYGWTWTLTALGPHSTLNCREHAPSICQGTFFFFVLQNWNFPY